MFSVTSSAATFFAPTTGRILLYRFRGARSYYIAGVTLNLDSSNGSAINCRLNKKVGPVEGSNLTTFD
jgi:hypothetical protein